VPPPRREPHSLVYCCFVFIGGLLTPGPRPPLYFAICRVSAPIPLPLCPHRSPVPSHLPSVNAARFLLIVAFFYNVLQPFKAVFYFNVLYFLSPQFHFKNTNRDDITEHVFHFIGGPGGTGKSALFKKLHAACRRLPYGCETHPHTFRHSRAPSSVPPLAASLILWFIVALFFIGGLPMPGPRPPLYFRDVSRFGTQSSPPSAN